MLDTVLAKKTLQIFFSQIEEQYRLTQKPESLPHTKIVTNLSHSPIIEFDLILGEKIVKALGSITSDPVFTEETITQNTQITTEYYWLVDPIDGTREFVKKIPECVTSIAYIHAPSGQVIYAAIYNLFTGELFVTESSPQAYKPQVAQTTPLVDSPLGPPKTLLFSRSESAKGWLKYFENMKDLFDPIIPMGSIAHKIFKVGCDPQNFATVSLAPKSKWDVAGAIGFCSQNPRVSVTDLQGRRINFCENLSERLSGIIAAEQNLHAEILGRLAKFNHLPQS